MKIADALDSLLDTRAKRVMALRLVFCIMTMIGLIPLLLISFKLIDLRDYDSLFALQSQLGDYQYCFLVRIIMSLASTSGWRQILQGIAGSIRPFNVLYVLILLLNLVFAQNTKLKKVFVWISVGAVVVLIGLSGFAFGASSLAVLIRILRLMGLFNCLLAAFLGGCCVFVLLKWASGYIS